MFEEYGGKRAVQSDKRRNRDLPVFTWQLDNNRSITADELRINVKMILLESASFKTFSVESNYNKKIMSEKIIKIVNDRGKLHNPYTDTGGTLSGIVDEIGADYNNSFNLRVGDEVIALISTTMIPLHIEKIINIDF